MPRISLSPKFIKEVLLLFRERPLKQILFGTRVNLALKDADLIQWIHEHPQEFADQGGRKGVLRNADYIHKGKGTVYVMPNKLGDEINETLILFDTDTKITNGPDLWVYLSSNRDVKREGLGDHRIIALLSGNQGGQSYIVQSPSVEIARYHSVVIWCKQFEVLFSFAPLE